MKSTWIIFALMCVTSVSGAQQKTILCTEEKADSHCQIIWRNNYPYTIVKNGPIAIVASSSFYFDKKTFYRWVGVANHGDDLIDLGLAHFVSTFNDGATSSAADPERLLFGSHRHSTFKNVLQGSLDLVATGEDPILVTDSDGNGRYVTYFTNGAGLRQEARQRAIDDSFQSLLSSALQHNSLQKEEKVLGVVYFPIPKNSSKNSYLTSTTLTIGDTAYVF